jgi:hypothetical protein
MFDITPEAISRSASGEAELFYDVAFSNIALIWRPTLGA